eukprot:CAMPEP_0114354894 /NCGR_PEP_ID=MMETSP0101-20121206/19813_1 /TAXON_ID=38822 ORGANISM="Pteridomonas danica, Strain PT" /NCGR_SAMPLE_ID=MMETSP0101 /ASSEMBLY_ACC=CAM_ASM_000211 /LENGTH=292 /DNA_ID=CAMNT_0001496573 /DNA_START=151 /DNA_END=1029 /DNA_ORIENTATION=-
MVCETPSQEEEVQHDSHNNEAKSEVGAVLMHSLIKDNQKKVLTSPQETITESPFVEDTSQSTPIINNLVNPTLTTTETTTTSNDAQRDLTIAALKSALAVLETDSKSPVSSSSSSSSPSLSSPPLHPSESMLLLATLDPSTLSPKTNSKLDVNNDKNDKHEEEEEVKLTQKEDEIKEEIKEEGEEDGNSPSLVQEILNTEMPSKFKEENQIIDEWTNPEEIENRMEQEQEKVMFSLLQRAALRLQQTTETESSSVLTSSTEAKELSSKTGSGILKSLIEKRHPLPYHIRKRV